MLLLSETDEALDPEVAQDFYYAVLDFSAQGGPDYFFKRWVTPWWKASGDVAVLRVGDITVKLPYSWAVVCATSGTAELVSPEELSGRDMQAFVYNPLSGFRPEYPDIRFKGGEKDQTWSCPILADTQLLLVPVLPPRRGRGPGCIVCGERGSRVPPEFDVSELW